MDPQVIRTKVKQVISNVTGIAADEIPDSANFREDLDLDSLSLLEVAVDVDYEFRLGVPEEQLQGLQTIDDTVRLVQEKLQEKAAATEAPMVEMPQAEVA